MRYTILALTVALGACAGTPPVQLADGCTPAQRGIDRNMPKAAQKCEHRWRPEHDALAIMFSQPNVGLSGGAGM